MIDVAYVFTLAIYHYRFSLSLAVDKAAALTSDFSLQHDTNSAGDYGKYMISGVGPAPILA